MDYFANFRALEDKLANLLDANNMMHNMKHDRYPITLTIMQNKAVDAQMELYSVAEGNVSSPESVLRFTFTLDGLEIQTDDRFVITDELLSKIKGQAKKLHAEYVHAYFAATANMGLLSRATDAAPEVDEAEDEAEEE